MDNLPGDWVNVSPSSRTTHSPTNPSSACRPTNAIGRWRLRLLLPLAGLGLVLVLAGCTDDTAGYQFANSPRPTRQAATPTVVATQPPPPPTAEVPPPRPFADLVVPRGAPDRIYFVAGPELWTVAASGSKPGRVFAPAPGESIVASSPSPSGDRVAVLVAGPDDANSVRVFAPDGEVVEVFEEIPNPLVTAVPPATPAGSSPAAATPVAGQDLASPFPVATPVAGEAAPRSIDWSPQGDQLLLGYEPGGLVALPVDGEGEVRQVLPIVEAPAPEDAALSPTGEQVAFASGGDARGGRGLYLASVEPASDRVRPLVEASPDRAVFEFSWLPDGRSLLFTEGDASAARSTNTDLWRITTDGEGRRLVASAGSAAPVADIDLFSPSPDGRAVAYTVVVPGESGAQFHSLWIRDLAAGQTYPVSVPSGIEVSNLWWTSEGLVFRTTGDGGQGAPAADSFELYRVDEAGEALLILRAMVGAATPAATPAAAPASD